ncbi:MAG: biopolymer transporter ExbD [Saprospirales bacterium]|nr:MAG: biopolymer transporter ExbD [Saprospirales bacterium]
MARKSARDRMSNEINAGAMADIAFLLLIFFLVTTTIMEDKGILVRLPPWSDEEPEIVDLNQRNVFSILVNAQNQLLVRGEPARVGDLKERAMEFIMNPNDDPTLSESPQRAVISLKNDRGTSYRTYIEVYNEIMAAYNSLRDDASRARFGTAYDNLELEQRRVIREEIPMIISEAEPTDFGEEG